MQLALLMRGSWGHAEIEACEAAGVLPHQLLEIYIALIPKMSGGRRPIGLYPSLFRVWAKVRFDIVKDWENSTTKGLGFAADCDNAAVDVVWRHACRAELAQSSSQKFAVVLWDLHKCYEMVNHSLLCDAARRHMYPLAILRLALCTYRAPRRILLNGIISREICPQAGILAGCSSATTELRLLLLDAVRLHNIRHPLINLNVYVDDVALDAVDASRIELAEKLSDAAFDLAVSLERDAQLPIARNKSSVLSNDRQAAKLIRNCLGDLGGPSLGTVRSLGADFWCAAPSVRNVMPIRAARRRSVATRKSRLKALKRAVPAVAAQVYFCGCLPALQFDASLYGLFDRPLKGLRREAGIMLGILGKKRNVDLAFSLVPDKDPEITFSVPVVRRFCGEIYNAALPREHRNPSGIALGVLACGIKNYLDRNPSPPKHVPGPLAAFHKTLLRAEWKFVSPFVLESRSSANIHLLTTCPTRIVDLFKNDLKNCILNRAVETIGSTRNPPQTDVTTAGVFYHPLTTLYRKFDPVQRNELVKIVTCSFHTNTLLASMGYDLDPTCAACGLAADTTFHRCISCPNIEHRAKCALGEPLFNRLVEAGPDSLLFRCVFPMPAFKSQPSSCTLYETIGLGADELLTDLSTDIYGDGSCLYPSFAPLARAGFAVVQVNDEGDIHRAIYGCVPKSLPQTSLSGEVAAFLCAAENSRDATFFGDCQAVLDAFHAGIGPAMRSKSNPHADTWRIMHHRFGDGLLDRVSSTVKVKAHQTLTEVQNSGGDTLRYWGNFHADALAKLGAALHEPDQDDVRAYKSAKKDLVNLVHHIIDAMSPLRLSRTSSFVKAPRLPAVPILNPKSTEEHCYRWQGKMWTCSLCLFRTHSPLLVPPSRRVCNGNSYLSDLLHNAKGHRLMSASICGGGVITYCTKCWCYASTFPKRLGEQCRGAPLKSRHSRHFLTNRMHPVSRRRLLCPSPLHA